MKNIKVMWFGREEELVFVECAGDFVSYDHKFLGVERLGEKWRAEVDGPWCDESIPYGDGDTLEEAIAALEIQMKELYEYVKQIVEGTSK